MSKIEADEKLDYSDVLIRPKRSNLDSRSAVNMIRTKRFRHSPIVWSGTPIISANMDTTGTFEVYDTLSQHNIVTAMHKFYTKEDYIERNREVQWISTNLFMVSTGIGVEDYEKTKNILSAIKCNWIYENIDIANGYMNRFI